MIIIYWIVVFTLTVSACFAIVFVMLMARKIRHNRLEKRNREYIENVYPLVSSYITDAEQFRHRIFSMARPWQKKLLVGILMDISSKVSSGEERERIAEVCRLMGVPEQLRRQFGHRQWWKVGEAIRQAGVLRLTELMPEVKAHLSSPVYDVWATAARTISLMGRNDALIDYLLDHYAVLRRERLIRMTDILRALTDEDIARIEARMDSAPPVLKGLFIDACAQSRSISAIPMLERLLDSEDREIRARALKSIAEIGFATRHDKVLELARSDSWVERMHSVRLIRSCSMERGIPLLVELLGDREWWVRYRAAESLTHFGEVGRSRLMWAREHHPDAFARDMAAQILAG
jgi:hypothetical protein